MCFESTEDEEGKEHGEDAAIDQGRLVGRGDQTEREPEAQEVGQVVFYFGQSVTEKQGPKLGGN